MRCCLSLLVGLLSVGFSFGQLVETLPPLADGKSPQDFQQMWNGFDPQAEPLEVEVLHQWEEDDVVLKVLRYRVGVFKGRTAMLAAVYGYPKTAVTTPIPGLVQIHGGGQYADYKACLTNAKRGYATISLAWAGRISAPGYQVSPAEVKLFWNGQTDASNYRVTTDWGAVDGYHAPGRNPRNHFPSAGPAEWTLDSIESPRNSGWFLCALAARRALTFLERQPEVDPHRLGVYGHSMGGKLTVLTSVDPRVKAAAPSCGGISDRENESAVFRATLGDGISLQQIKCPIMFLSPANDFHGRIGDLPKSVAELQSKSWRVTCSPHHNHQDTSEYEVATQLWMDQYLYGRFQMPATPQTELQPETEDSIPRLTIKPDVGHKVLGVDVYYTFDGKANEGPQDRLDTMHRFWHHASATQQGDQWVAQVPLTTTEKPLWVYANVRYPLEQKITAAGYYYGIYEADQFNLSSLITRVPAETLVAAKVKVTLMPTSLIDDFQTSWQHDWFAYREPYWAKTTNKLRDLRWQPPKDAQLVLEASSPQPNQLVLLMDQYAAVVKFAGGNEKQEFVFKPSDFKNHDGERLAHWNEVRTLKLSPAERLRPGRGSQDPATLLGGQWKGDSPTFHELRWE